MFESLIDRFFVTTRQAEFREYLPYVLVIGAILLWFIRGITKDVLRDFLRVRRRRWLGFVVRGRVRYSSYWRHYVGEVGPCVGSPFRARWEQWLASFDESKVAWLLTPEAEPNRAGGVRGRHLRNQAQLRVASRAS